MGPGGYRRCRLRAMNVRVRWVQMTRQLLLGSLVVAAVMMMAAYPEAGRNGVRARAASTAKPYIPPKTPWGDPDIHGGYTNVDESGIPLEKPSQFAGKSLEEVDNSELADIVRARQERATARVNGVRATVSRRHRRRPRALVRKLRRQEQPRVDDCRSAGGSRSAADA